MKTWICLLLVLTITACKTYQIATVKSRDVSLISDKYSYANDTLAINYQFWQQNGSMNFEIYNKTDQPIYINWKNSAYIDNGEKKAYWVDGSQSQFYGTSNNIGFGVSTGRGKTITVKDEQVTSIPPHSRIKKSTFILYPNIKVPIASKKLKTGMTFDRLSSPIKFRNYIAYSATETFNATTFLDNDFYVSSLRLTKGGKLDTYKSPSNFFIRDYSK